MSTNLTVVNSWSMRETNNYHYIRFTIKKLTMYKSLTLLICLFGLNYSLLAQVPRDKIKSNDFIEKRLSRPGRVSGIAVNKKELGANCIVVIDNKIFDSDSEQLHKIPKDSLELITSVEDTLTSASTKCILIYKSKPKAIDPVY